MTGSHIDTQPTGGKFDGVLGVLSGLEVIRSIRDMGIMTRRPIVVTNWTNEEGARFAPAMLASGVFAGVLTEDYANSRTDAEGKRYTYTVFRKFVVDPGATHVLRPIKGKSVVSLQTCTLPDYSKRLVVQGELVEVA